METKHTPGPWQYVMDGDDRNIKDANGRTIQSDATYYPWCSCNEYDWHLIAAAPELLSLLQELVDIEGPQPGTSAWADKARTAIAKATGAT